MKKKLINTYPSANWTGDLPFWVNFGLKLTRSIVSKFPLRCAEVTFVKSGLKFRINEVSWKQGWCKLTMGCWKSGDLMHRKPYLYCWEKVWQFLLEWTAFCSVRQDAKQKTQFLTKGKLDKQEKRKSGKVFKLGASLTSWLSHRRVWLGNV